MDTILNELIPTSGNDIPIHMVPTEEYNNDELTDFHIHKEDLKQIIWRQKSSSPEADGITIKILKAIWPTIADALTKLMTD